MICDLQVFWIFFRCFGRAYLRWRFSIGGCAVQPFVLVIVDPLSLVHMYVLNSSNHHLPINFCWIELPLKGDTFLQFYMVIALRLVDATLDVLDKRSSSCPVQYTTFNRWCIVSLSLLLQIGEFWWGTMLSIVNGSLFLVKLRVSEKQLQWSSEVMMTKWKNRAFLRSFFGQRYL